MERPRGYGPRDGSSILSWSVGGLGKLEKPTFKDGSWKVDPDSNFILNAMGAVY